MSWNIESGPPPTTDDTNTWEKLVKKAADEKRCMSHICRYDPLVGTSVNQNVGVMSSCGQSLKPHNVRDESQLTHPTKLEREHTAFVEMAINDYGTLSGNIRFIRCSSHWPGTYQTLKDLITEDVKEPPQLIVSCFGGAQYFAMSDDLEKVFINAIGEIAATKKVWLLTTGMNSGVSKLIGQAVCRHKLLHDNSFNPTLIGMTSWDILADSTRQYIQDEGRASKPDAERWLQNKCSFPFDDDQAKVPDVHHTHLILLDINRPKYYLDDEPRSRFVEVVCKESKCHAVTIIVEGGRFTPDVILKDVQAGRPVVIIHGSGRIASLLGMLLEPTDDKTEDKFNNITDKIKRHLTLFPTLGPDYIQEQDRDRMIDDIEKVLDPEYRPYLKVFNLQRDTNLTDTIFQAVFDVAQNRKVPTGTARDPNIILDLAVSWNCVNGAHEIFERDQNLRGKFPELFKHALLERRPKFVDYFLRRNYDPFRASAKKNNNTGSRESAEGMSGRQIEINSIERAFNLIGELYQQIAIKHTIKSWENPNSPRALNQIYKKFIGPYVKSFFYNESKSQRFTEDIRRLIGKSSASHSFTRDDYQDIKPYSKERMLRDIFLWSVFAGYDDIAFVLLLQIKERIGAALLATAIAKRVSFLTTKLDERRKFEKQADAYETYATECIKLCHQYDEQHACQMLLLRRPFYGDITYMQISISSHIKEFVNTDTFDKVLTEWWDGHWDNKLDESIKGICAVAISLFTLGLPAPVLCTYCPDKKFGKRQKKSQRNGGTQRNNTSKYVCRSSYLMTRNSGLLAVIIN